MPEIKLLSNKPTLNRSSPLLDFARSEKLKEVYRFHKGIRGYDPTPLIDLTFLAKKLGLRRILIKDERFRFGLNAFKALGASYAIAEFLSIERLEPQLVRKTLVTATDGNHGKAVAWAAQQLGFDSHVFIPEGAHRKRVESIRSHGARVDIGGVNYEAAIEKAIQASEAPDRFLIQDTAWDGYEEIPRLITQGYYTLVSEFADQCNGSWPTHVFIQAGVGSLAAGVIAAFYSFEARPLPRFVIVEPIGAACVYESAIRGKLHTIEGKHETVMDCLSCGRPSLTAWELMRQTAFAFLTCEDEITEIGRRVLANPYGYDTPVYSGKSGAVTTGLIFEVIRDPNHSNIAAQLGLNQSSVVLLFSTEGDSENLL